MAWGLGLLFGAVLWHHLGQVRGIPFPAPITNDVFSSAAGLLKFNIDPDITSKLWTKTREPSTGWNVKLTDSHPSTDPDCTASYPVNVNIKAAASSNHETSPACDSIWAYIAQQRGRVDADLMITCSGVAIEHQGDRPTKFILSYASDGGSAGVKREVVEQEQEQDRDQEAVDSEAQLQADDEKQIDARLTIQDNSPGGFNVEGVPVVLGVRVDSSKAQAVYQFIYCP